MSTQNPLAAPSPLRDIINPQFHQNNFPAEQHIKTELGLRLDKGLFAGYYFLSTFSYVLQMIKYVGWH